MMWAATVRRCPTGHARHPSQFGARLQLARALTHAPYLICDGVYSCPPPTHVHFDSDMNVRYSISYTEPPLQEPDIISDHVVDFDSSYRQYNSQNGQRGGWTPQNSRRERPPPETQHHFREGRRNVREREEVRVELPYSRRELEASEDYTGGVGEHIVRRYEDYRRDEPEDDSVVGLSYQQRSMRGPGPYGGEVWGNEPSIDCWGDKPMLLKRGRTREIVRTMFVIALSLTLVIFVVMGFAVYNMLITTLFLFFLLSTVSLLIFLLMRKPTCFSCCKEPFDMSTTTDEDTEVQQGLSSYLTESQGVVVKKRLSDSPPPYESPPDYNSLPPEVLVSARGLSGLEAIQENLMVRVHGGEAATAKAITPKPNRRRRNRIREFAARSSSSLLASAAPLLSSSRRTSPPASPSLRSSGGRMQGVTAPCRQPEETSAPPTPPPPAYECIVIQTEVSNKDNQKRC